MKNDNKGAVKKYTASKNKKEVQTQIKIWE